MEITEHANTSRPGGSVLIRSGDVTQFTEIDLTPDAGFFVDFMDVVHTQPDRQRLKGDIADRLNVSPGDRVLDVGCGTGNDARMLASLVGPTGQVTGIDVSKTMIDVAQERSRASSLPVSFALGDARSLDFSNNAFDACRCETVLMHLDGAPACAIAEMARVTRPEGRVVVADFYWDAMVIDHPARSRTRKVIQTACDAIRHGWIGGQLPRLMADAGLINLGVEGFTLRFTHKMVRGLLKGPLAGARQQDRLDAIDIAQWWRPLDDAEIHGQFLATMLMFIVTGTVAT
jgi:ubiquinone/menaquinone biosynthesis C-methylase UbiE